MEDQILRLIEAGKISNLHGTPKVIETTLSRVYIFEQDNIVLKLYKRDNLWWNSNIDDLSQGKSRINFIRNDFEFNQFLNPKIYSALKLAVIKDSAVNLQDPKISDDELVIVMQKEATETTFSDILFTNSLSLAEYKDIGKSFAQIKLALPKKFLPKSQLNWYQQFEIRLNDLIIWVSGEQSFPQELAENGWTLIKKKLQKYKLHIKAIPHEDLFVLIDCNGENLRYINNKLSFIDAYPPKDTWQIGSFDIDIFRIASDIYVFAGEQAYCSYLEGVDEIAGGLRDKNLEDFYLLCGAMSNAPFYFMMTRKNIKFKARADKYLKFVEQLLNEF